MRQHPVARGHAFPHGSPSLLRIETAPEQGVKARPGNEGTFEEMVIASGPLLSGMRHGFLPGGNSGTCWLMIRASNSIVTRLTQIVDHAEIGPVGALRNVKPIEDGQEGEVASSEILPVVKARLGTKSLKKFGAFQASRAKQLDEKVAAEIAWELYATKLAARAAALARR